MDTRKIFILIKLALFLVLLLVTVRTIITPLHLGRIFRPTSAAGTDYQTTIETSISKSTPSKDYNAIIERNLFGCKEPLTEQQRFTLNSDSTNLILSTGKELGLTLLGTICGSPAISRAIIKNVQNNKVELHKTGDFVATASIESIEKDAIILLHKGKRKKLTLGAEQSVNNTNKSSLHNKPEVQKSKTQKTLLPTDIESPITESQTKTHNIESVLKQAVIEPYDVNGQIEGLKISGIENIPMANVFGLKNGDVIQIVNGQRITSKQKAFQIFKKARTQTTMNIELLRNGQTNLLTFHLW